MPVAPKGCCGLAGTGRDSRFCANLLPSTGCMSCGNQATGRVPAANNALSGCPLDASGVLLQGPPDMMALDGVHDLDHEHGSPASVICCLLSAGVLLVAALTT